MKSLEKLKGKYCVIRGDRSGVFAGNIVDTSEDGKMVELTNCRRLRYWDGACSISEIAKSGVTRPEDCKFTVTIDELLLTDVIEIIPATLEAEKCIKGVREWKKN